MRLAGALLEYSQDRRLAQVAGLERGAARLHAGERVKDTVDLDHDFGSGHDVGSAT